jgi:hypothetical protein
MKGQALARINSKMKSADWRLDRMISQIDKIKKSKEARGDDNILHKHLSDITDDGERVWSF